MYKIKLRKIFLIVLLSVSLVNPVLSAPDTFYGVFQDILWDPVDFNDSKSYWNAMKELQVGSVATPFRHAAFFSKNSQSSCSSLALKMDIVNEYRKRLLARPKGMEVMGVLMLNGESVECVSEYEIDGDAESAAQTYADHVGQIVNQFSDIVTEWVIGNESNNNAFSLRPVYRSNPANGDYYHAWTPGDILKHFLEPVAQAIRENDPGANILLDGITYNGLAGHIPEPAQFSFEQKLPQHLQQPPPGSAKTWYVEKEFIPALYQGIDYFNQVPDTYFDAIALHPYYHIPEAVKNTFDRWSPDGSKFYMPGDQTYGSDGTATILSRDYNDSRPIYWTELGEKETYAYNDIVSEEVRASRIQSILQDAANYRYRANNPLKKVIVYILKEPANGSDPELKGFGLLGPDQRRRATFYAFKDVTFSSSTTISSLRDRFELKPETNKKISDIVWGSICNGSCSYDIDNINSELTLKSGYSWGKSAVYSRKPLLLDEPFWRMKIKINSDFGFSTEGYNIISIAPPGKLGNTLSLTGSGSLNIYFRKLSSNSFSYAIESMRSDGSKEFLVSWNSVWGCDLNKGLIVDFMVSNNSKQFQLKLKNGSTFSQCSFVGASASKLIPFGQQSSLNMRLMSMDRFGTNTKTNFDSLIFEPVNSGF